MAYDNWLRVEAKFEKPEVADVGGLDSDYVGSLGGSVGAWVGDRTNVFGAGTGREAAAHCVGLGCGVGYAEVGGWVQGEILY